MAKEMRSQRNHIIVLCWLLMLTGEASASPESRKFLVYDADDAACETEMAHLDNYAIEIQNESKLKAYVIAYGGRRGTARLEMRARRARIRRYLVGNRGIDPKRVLVVDGGFRERLTVELWLVPEGERMPKATPTVSPKDIKYKRAKYGFDCSTFY
jgi:hypothetical protein